jgi:hypothetical protein
MGRAVSEFAHEPTNGDAWVQFPNCLGPGRIPPYFDRENAHGNADLARICAIRSQIFLTDYS